MRSKRWHQLKRARQKWTAKNPDKVRKYNRDAYRRHKAKRLSNQMRWYYEHKKEIQASVREKRKSDPAWFIYHSAKHRAKVNGLEFSITKDDIKIPERCPILGIPLVMGTKDDHDGSPSIDRVDPSKGYTVNNIQVISHRANRLKSDSTAEDLQLIINYLKNTKPT